MSLSPSVQEIIKLLTLKTEIQDIEWVARRDYLTVTLSRSSVRVSVREDEGRWFATIVLFNSQGLPLQRHELKEGDEDFEALKKLGDLAHESVYKTEQTIEDTLRELRGLDAFGDEPSEV